MPPLLTERRPATAGSATHPSRRRRGAAVLLGGLALAVLLVGHGLVPDLGGLGFLLDSVLPWLGLAVVPIAIAAAVARTRLALVGVLVPVAVWSTLFVPALLPLSGPGAGRAATPGDDGTLTVASQNLQAGSGTAAHSARALAATGADVVAVQEVDASSRAEVTAELDADYPYAFTVGTVGVYSRFPIDNAQPLDLGLGWNRALAADLETAQGPVSIYVVHAASARPGDTADRDVMLRALADMVPRDENDRMVMIGDFNAGSDDRAFAPLAARLDEPNLDGGGLGFTWPADLPGVRLDHVLQRGLEPVSNTTMRAGASDHLALVTTFRL